MKLKIKIYRVERGQCVDAVTHENIIIFLPNDFQISVEVGETVESRDT